MARAKAAARRKKAALQGEEEPPEQGEESIDLQVGGRIRALRKVHQWTLKDLAGRLGISYVYLSELERGEKPWKLEKLAQTATVFKVPLSLLQEPSVPLERLHALAEMLEKISALPEEQFAAVAQLLESIHS